MLRILERLKNPSKMLWLAPQQLKHNPHSRTRLSSERRYVGLPNRNVHHPAHGKVTPCHQFTKCCGVLSDWMVCLDNSVWTLLIELIILLNKALIRSRGYKVGPVTCWVLTLRTPWLMGATVSDDTSDDVVPLNVFRYQRTYLHRSWSSLQAWTWK